MSVANAVKGLHDVTIVANNVAELRGFYRALGFAQVVDQGDDLAVFVVGQHELAIHTSSTKPIGVLVLSLAVTDLDAVVRSMTELGVEFDGPAPMRPGMVGIAIRDPNGNKLEFLGLAAE